MKKVYLVVLFLLGHISLAQNFTDTKGELQISASGTATYTLPIALPPSIKGIAPTISLNYSSGLRGGIAGQGWSINSISAISRIATRLDIDGFVDGVDFDDNDKLALDGQRLLIKSGIYWGNGSTYETEYKSNTKIELKIEGAVTYFIVTNPDGSRIWYGSKGSGSLQNSVSLNTWYIVHYEDVNGNFIDYNYKTVNHNNTFQLYIDTIIFSGNSNAGIAAQNKIRFNYEQAARIERDFIKGTSSYASQLLKSIEVYANNSLFRKYTLSHTEDSFGYQRVKEIQEINAQNEMSNPVVFEYNSSSSDLKKTEKNYVNTLAFEDVDLAGDFDGDGKLDFVAKNQIYTKLFEGNSGNLPINLPFNILKNFCFSANTLLNNKLNQNQSIVNVEPLTDGLKFNIYDLSSDIITNIYSKTVIIGKPTEIMGYSYNFSKFVEGDFNGDGISEVLIISTPTREVVSENDPCHWYGTCGFSNSFTNFHLLDLNPNSSANFGNAGLVKIPWAMAFDLDQGKRFVSDFNSDGKSDILVINEDKKYKIFSFKQLTSSPWVELQVLGSGVLDAYSSTKQLLLGDFNGDGKTDIMLPDSEGGEGEVKWHIYYSNPNPAGGEFFLKESHDIVEYRPDTTKENKPYDMQAHFSTYYAIDINGDGKSDLVRVWRKYYKPKWTINDHDTAWLVTGFVNNIGKAGASGFVHTYSSGNDSGSPDIPIPLVSNYRNNGSNTDLVIVRGHKEIVEYYKFNKNVGTDNRLKSVTEASGNIKQSIDYLPMEAVGGGLGNTVTDFYSSGNSVNYPNIEIIRNYDSYLVSRITATINGVSKYQDFRYRGYVLNFNYGTVGFIKTTRSSWYLSDSDTKLWTTQYNDVNLRGANTITWTSTNASTVFDGLPTGLVSTKTNYFEAYTKGGNIASENDIPANIDINTPVVTNQLYKARSTIVASSTVDEDVSVQYKASQVILKPGFSIKPGNNGSFRASSFSSDESNAPVTNSSVYNVLLSKQITEDHVTGIKNETVFTYDGTVESPNYYGLEMKSISKQFNGGVLQGSTTIESQYDSNPDGLENAYYIGRPKTVKTSSNNIAAGDTRTSEEIYTYTGTNLTKTEKKGHNTYAIVEDMTYDIAGNLLTKTVSAPTAPSPPLARTIKDEYDETKRFVIKKTDHQNFVTTFAYNTLGQVKESVDYMGVVSKFDYDNWGKLTTSTVTNSAYLPIITSIAYSKLASGGYTTTTTNNLEAKTVTQYDVLGRIVVSSTKGFAPNSMVSKQIVYDGLGRKTKESEPYFSAPNLWTVYEYDYLMRPTKVTAPTGKVQELSYSGLTTTSNDDGKITTATLDALGNKIKSTDPGGTINFTYFAGGQLKTADYDGSKVEINIDGWGNKVEMKDPSAGTYTYKYDAFGQLITETTPNGTTSIVYDAAGNPKEKKIKGINTDSRTNYTYNTFNQPTSSTYTDNLESKTTTNVYEYDALNRLFKTTETTPYATFVKEFSFDNLGRTDKETSLADATGKRSTVTVKNTYQNGFPWQIIDNNTQQVLWQSNTLNERGQLLTAVLGNGIAITNIYDQYGYTQQIKHDKTSPVNTNIMTLNTDFEIKRGNLNSRYNSLFGKNETYKYDALDRLTEYTNRLGIQETQSYDDKGRITQNSVGTYQYDTGKTYQNKTITPSPEALEYYIARPLLNVTYNTFKSPYQIDESGVDKISFTYNDSNNRSSMFYGGLQDEKSLRAYRKHYAADGTMEVKHNIETGAVEILTYIGGDAYSAPLVVKDDALGQNYLYLHRDYQGSIVAITNQTGTIVEKRLFDAWGAIVAVQDGNGTALTGLTILDRGYTGHEHLQSVGIVHMNGRLYDPKLHRFMQPDNYVQEPYNTQNYNKYGYCWNNPLKYTDPSGEFIEIGIGGALLIGAGIAALTYTITALLTDVPFSIGGLAKATFVGAASSAVTFGIGSAAGNLFTKFYSQAAFQAVAHGTFQGSMTAISGGKFWSGFASGALSSIAASAWSGGTTQTEGFSAENNWAYGTKTISHQGISGAIGANNAVGMIAFGTVSGGVGARLTGSNFWQGAITGLVVSGLNHAMHEIDPPGKKVNNGFIKKGSLDNTKTALDVGGVTFGALESSTFSGGQWLGKNGKYYSTSWGGNGATGGRSGALKAAGNYKFAGNAIIGVNVVIGGVETYNGYQMDGRTFGYNAQRAAASSAGSIAGGWAGGLAGAQAGAAVGVWFDGVGAIPGAIGGFVFGYFGGMAGGKIGGKAVDYYHNK